MSKACLLGLDIGSSSVKASLVEVDSGVELASTQSPENEMPMIAHHPGWAEQEPDWWWQHTQHAVQSAMKRAGRPEVKSIGISYQMHGLVLVDKDHRPLRPSIIWCDSRAVILGDRACQSLGIDYCQQHLLNSPGNFTAAKLAWVKENEPHIFKQIFKFMLPGDYIAMRLTGTILTTSTGLSEGVMWDFQNQSIATKVLQHFGIDHKLMPDITPVFADQGQVLPEAAEALGIRKGIPVAYRAGDQPNNAFSLNVLKSGETAATAGTSGVVYSVTNKNVSDPHSRVNTFVHVNNIADQIRNGVLLCVNGTGIANSWLKKLLGRFSYDEMNQASSSVPIGSEGLTFLPFGNGTERMLQNQLTSASWVGLDFNHHQTSHMMRSVQEGIVFAMRYGFEVLKELGATPSMIRAGQANLFLSPLFREAFVNTLSIPLELLDTNGAKGAALGSGVGASLYSSADEALHHLKVIQTISPEREKSDHYEEAYQRWKKILESNLVQSK